MSTTEGRLTPEREELARRYASAWADDPVMLSETLVIELLNALDAVRRERDEARKDSARLDWMASQSYVEASTQSGPESIKRRVGLYWWARKAIEFRASLDAAMAKDGGA